MNEFLGGDRRGVGLQDPGVGLEDLAQGPERDPLAVRQAAALAPGDEAGLRVGVRAELGDEAALAHAGLAHDRDETHRVGGHALVEEALEERQIDLAANERAAVGAGDVGTETGAGRGGLEHPDRLGLSL